MAAALLRGELIDDGVRVATIAEDGDLRELSVRNLRESLRVARFEVHGRRRVSNMLKSTVTTASSESGAGVEGGVLPACSTRLDASSAVSEGVA